MELHERLAATGEAARLPHDPFAELKNRVHLGLIEDLGRQIFGAAVDEDLIKARITAEIHARLEQEPGLSKDDRERLVGELRDDVL
ncbi:MAG TPA: hypothetical protein VHS55_05675, partial [Solirubrobacteraceae bacterium]|nr:hypothetical protein [Solirubrobacteraceae bacterium]